MNTLYCRMTLANKLLIFTLVSIVFTSCDKHLDIRTFKSKDITINWYRISTITTIHDYVDLERWGHTENILKANTNDLYDILIDGDTIMIQTLPSILIYDLATIKLGCIVKLDSSISKCQYMKKHVPENAKYYCDTIEYKTSKK
jgi:hypothetical protein